MASLLFGPTGKREHEDRQRKERERFMREREAEQREVARKEREIAAAVRKPAGRGLLAAWLTIACRRLSISPNMALARA